MSEEWRKSTFVNPKIKLVKGLRKAITTGGDDAMEGYCPSHATWPARWSGAGANVSFGIEGLLSIRKRVVQSKKGANPEWRLGKGGDRQFSSPGFGYDHFAAGFGHGLIRFGLV